MSLWLDQRSHGQAERSRIETARPAIGFRLSTLATGWHEIQISWIVNQQLEERKETKQSQGLYWGLDRSGSGSGSAYESDPRSCDVAAWTQLGRKQVDNLAA